MVGGFVTAGLLLALTQHAHAASPTCLPGAQGTLATSSRGVVPIGAAATRTFTVNKGAPATITNLAVTAPAGYGAVHVASNKGYALRLQAPQAGTFDVHATWTETRGLVTCDASGALTLTATAGSPLPVSPPRWKSLGVSSPLVWRWTCKPDSDPMPRRVLIRWEFDPKTLPYFARGGHAPFRFKRRPKTLTATTADPCDPLQTGGFIRKRLQKGGKLSVFIGGNAATGVGGLSVKFGGIVRDPRTGSPHPLHLEIILQEGSRKLVDEKACAFDSYSWQHAKGKHVLCWF